VQHGRSVFADVFFTPVAVFHEIVDATLKEKPVDFANRKTGTFAYSSLIGISVQCRLDGVLKPCTFGADHKGSVTLTNLTKGPHTFQVNATSSKGGNPSKPAALSVMDRRHRGAQHDP
jgi:hypothetical protein